VESPISGYSSQATAKAGESYVFNEGGENMMDLSASQKQSICVKAVTTGTSKPEASKPTEKEPAKDSNVKDYTTRSNSRDEPTTRPVMENKETEDKLTVTVIPAPTPKPTPVPVAKEKFVNPFVDIKESDWFYDGIAYVCANGFMSGANTKPMLFSPNVNLTRGMAVKTLHSLAGSPVLVNHANPFSDVSDGAYYADAVKWAAYNGIVSGYGNGCFEPEDIITRQDLLVILSRYAGFAGLSLSETRAYADFSDKTEIASYAYRAVQVFSKANIINGRPGNIFAPKDGATRAEFATVLHRFLQ
jgi:hypothetical protein